MAQSLTIQTILRDFVRAARLGFGRNLASVVIFGSVARGAHKPTSDIDLLAITANPSIAHGHVSSEFGVSFRASIHYLELAKHIVKHTVVPAVTCDGVETTLEIDRIPISFIFRTCKYNELSPLYFSLVSNSIPLVDKSTYMVKTLATIKHWMTRLKYERIPLGRGWYWRPGAPLTQPQLYTLGFRHKGECAQKWAKACLAKARITDNPNHALSLRREAANLFVRAQLAFSGIEPVKCVPWEHVILSRELGRYPYRRASKGQLYAMISM